MTSLYAQMALAKNAKYTTMHTLKAHLRGGGGVLSLHSYLRHESMHLLYRDLVAVFGGFSE